jgi:hypothetical protein
MPALAAFLPPKKIAVATEVAVTGKGGRVLGPKALGAVHDVPQKNQDRRVPSIDAGVFKV